MFVDGWKAWNFCPSMGNKKIPSRVCFGLGESVDCIRLHVPPPPFPCGCRNGVSNVNNPPFVNFQSDRRRAMPYVASRCQKLPRNVRRQFMLDGVSFHAQKGRRRCGKSLAVPVFVSTGLCVECGAVWGHYEGFFMRSPSPFFGLQAMRQCLPVCRVSVAVPGFLGYPVCPRCP